MNKSILAIALLAMACYAGFPTEGTVSCEKVTVTIKGKTYDSGTSDTTSWHELDGWFQCGPPINPDVPDEKQYDHWNSIGLWMPKPSGNGIVFKGTRISMTFYPDSVLIEMTADPSSRALHSKCKYLKGDPFNGK